MNFKINLILLFLLSTSFGLAQIDFIPKKSISQIKHEHNLLSRISYPNPNTSIIDSLLQQDFNKFDSLMEIAFVLKNDSLYESRIYDLITQLKAPLSEKILLRTAQELSAYGKQALIALEKSSISSVSFQYWMQVVRILVLGYEIDDFLINYEEDFRINYRQPNQISPKQYFNLYGTFQRERIYLQNILREFISSSSYQVHKKHYHKLAIDTYQKGTIHHNFKYSLIQQIVKQEAFSKNEEYLNDYRLLIDKIELKEAIDLINFINQGSSNSYYPQVFLDLLSSKNEKIVQQVIGWSANCWDEKMCDEVKELLIRIFKKGSKVLKFHAAFPLMHDYDNSEAYNYLLSLVETKNDANDDTLYTAISWLGDSCHNGKKMSFRLDSALKNHLNSENQIIKRATIETYLIYKSPNVIEALIPFVDYNLDFIAKEVQKKLLSFEDKAFTIAKLKQYLTSEKGTNVHYEILNKLK